MVNFSIMGYEHFECSFDETWKEIYDTGNYLLHDPVFKWALENEGAIRWSEIGLPDPEKILKKSQRHGLTFGAAFSALTGSRRSMIFVSRDDRELSDTEMRELTHSTTAFFNSLIPPPSPTADELAMLKLFIQEELSYAQIADRLCLSLSGVKSRFLRLREKYDCKSTAGLCYKAKELNLLGVEPRG
ncbi:MULTISPECIES: autoinducer binding domain-containing protein [Phaeobacter]|uniref:helix-turn-helix transcriptional regulator n=1 Tax=Phaeobacter TaxID=302485 RepID=UPI000693C7E3|nr:MULTISPECIES: autoinducer binding domain-containing protein [Phaeobacter]AUQ89370.1 Autoinducer binding domain protein [Phaeobacter inhibens]